MMRIITHPNAKEAFSSVSASAFERLYASNPWVIFDGDDTHKRRLLSAVTAPSPGGIRSVIVTEVDWIERAGEYRFHVGPESRYGFPCPKRCAMITPHQDAIGLCQTDAADTVLSASVTMNRVAGDWAIDGRLWTLSDGTRDVAPLMGKDGKAEQTDATRRYLYAAPQMEQYTPMDLALCVWALAHASPDAPCLFPIETVGDDVKLLWASASTKWLVQ